ncbi:MAG: cache domain-containing protein, partial [Lachnospiraceae bacterium]|nr:cache domain-containing protein [Lachnospiraceae bacterium]
MANKRSKEKKGANKGGSKLNMRVTLILFALIPLLASSIIISAMTIKESSSQITDYTHNSLVQVITDVGTSFDALCASNKAALKAYTSAPIIKEALRSSDNPMISQRAQAYTLDYFSKLDNWEGIYLADWNSQVLTHPNEGAIGMILREGDSLTGLQNNILNAPDGVFNTGIITSPASGQLIMSMYTPIFDDDGKTPLGFAGCGFYIKTIADAITDVSDLKLSSAYIYIVDSAGTMLYHPDESKIGNPVENAAVKSLLAKLDAGEHPAPDVITYEYKGANKYAAYYIGEGEKYIAVLTADESDVLSGVSSIKRNTIIVCIIAVILFSGLALVIERLISVPL